MIKTVIVVFFWLIYRKFYAIQDLISKMQLKSECIDCVSPGNSCTTVYISILVKVNPISSDDTAAKVKKYWA